MINCHQMRMILDLPSRLCSVHLRLEETEMCANETVFCNIRFIYLKQHLQIYIQRKTVFPKSKLLFPELTIKIVKFSSCLCLYSIYISLYWGGAWKLLQKAALYCNIDTKAQSKTNSLMKSLLLKLLGKKKRPSLWKQGIYRLNDLLQVIPE